MTKDDDQVALNQLKSMHAQFRDALLLCMGVTAVMVLAVVVGVMPPTMLLINIPAILIAGVSVVNNAGGTNRLWRYWKPYFVEARSEYDTEEVHSWVKSVLQPENVVRYSNTSAYAFRYASDAVAFKMVWG